MAIGNFAATARARGEDLFVVWRGWHLALRFAVERHRALGTGWTVGVHARIGDACAIVAAADQTHLAIHQVTRVGDASAIIRIAHQTFGAGDVGA